MAKRKTARSASRTRTPGAKTRRVTAGRAGTTSTASRTAESAGKTLRRRGSQRAAGGGAGRKQTAASKTGRGTAPGSTAGRKTLARKAAAAGTPPRKTAARRSSPASSPRGLATGAPPTRRRPSDPDRTREDVVAAPPSSLDLDRHASAARSGRAEFQEALHEHTESSPALTAGDVDANWQSAYSTGDEAPGGDMPTPDQDVVQEIATAVGVEYNDNEELKGVDKIERRDRHRWELDPASSEDYQERVRRKR